jgi:1-acyl-sn-glycerol-3-phosphate acyltransferase
MLSAVATQSLAIGVLVAAAAVLATMAVRAYRRTDYTPVQAAWMGLGYAVARVLWRATISGSLPVLPGKGAVILCNHRCSLDPAFVALGVRRPVRWMVAKEYWSIPVVGWMFRCFQCIPVSRAGTDTAPTKRAIRCAQQGDLVGMLPEGRINTTPQLLLPGRPGAALVALRARVPVVPCYIEGAPYDGTVWGCIFTPAKVRLVVGKPLDLSAYYGQDCQREVLETLTRRFLREIAQLAGQPEFEPKLAGRSWVPHD